MNVYEPGTPVRIGALARDIEAVIAQVCISGLEHRVTYEVVWWSDKSRSTAWIGSDEVFPAGEPKPLTIGFN